VLGIGLVLGLTRIHLRHEYLLIFLFFEFLYFFVFLLGLSVLAFSLLQRLLRLSFMV
jgi:hypothetical protein